jgi:hypothetical protein
VSEHTEPAWQTHRRTGTAGDWLAARDAETPAELRARVRAAVDRTADAGSTAATLVTAAITCMEEALAYTRVASAGSPERAEDEASVRAEALAPFRPARAAALPLLAADALLTYAAEAASEHGSSLDDLSSDVNGRLAALLGE